MAPIYEAEGGMFYLLKWLPCGWTFNWCLERRNRNWIPSVKKNNILIRAILKRTTILFIRFLTNSSIGIAAMAEALLDLFRSIDSKKEATESRSASNWLLPSFIPKSSSASRSLKIGIWNWWRLVEGKTQIIDIRKRKIVLKTWLYVWPPLCVKH